MGRGYAIAIAVAVAITIVALPASCRFSVTQIPSAGVV
jgi:hypothetical protein